MTKSRIYSSSGSRKASASSPPSPKTYPVSTCLCCASLLGQPHQVGTLHGSLPRVASWSGLPVADDVGLLFGRAANNFMPQYTVICPPLTASRRHPSVCPIGTVPGAPLIGSAHNSAPPCATAPPGLACQ
eukprot:scaffold7310_cov116-Isochrysis_galbana.AAC.11